MHLGPRILLSVVCAFALAALIAPAGAGAHDVTEVDLGAALDGSTHLDPIRPFTARDQSNLAVSSSNEDGGPSVRSIAQTCGTVQSSSDDTSHSYASSGSRVLKVIYAYPTNVGNRLATYAPVIQSGVRLTSEVVAGESANTKSLRFDLGTSSGADCVDIQAVPLSLPSTAYTAVPSTTFTLIRTELLAKIGLQPGNRNYMVYADGISLPGVGGEAQVRTDDSAAGTLHGLGGLWGILYGRGGTDFFGSSTAYGTGTTSRTHVDLALHEISHTLGAVQRSAPHASSSFHCLDEWDVLCYDDDGAGGASTYVACNTPTAQVWDCNKDDYFSPSPAPGSYLATHWNLYNSVFMCASAGCAPGGIQGPPIFQAASSADTTAPDTRINSGPRRKTRDRTPSFGFTASESGSKFECSYDRRAWSSCRTPMTLRKLKLGRHGFRVRATDRAGNRDATPATRSFKVDHR